MPYLVLIVHPDKDKLVDYGYYIKKSRNDVNFIIEESLINSERILNNEPIDALIIATKFNDIGDGVEFVKKLRQSHYKFLSVLFDINEKGIDFAKLYSKTQALGHLTAPLKQSELKHFLEIALHYANAVKNHFCFIPQRQGGRLKKAGLLITDSTFSHSEIRKGESIIDVYTIDLFTGEKEKYTLTEISVKKFDEYVKNISSIKQCSRFGHLGKKMISGYDGKKAFTTRRGDTVILGDKYEDDFIEYIKPR